MSSKNELIELLRNKLEIFKYDPTVKIKFIKELEKSDIIGLIREGVTWCYDAGELKDMKYFEINGVKFHIIVLDDKSIKVGFTNYSLPGIGLENKLWLIMENEIWPDVIIQYFYETDEEDEPGKNGIMFIQTFSKNDKKGVIILDIFHEFHPVEAEQIRMFTEIF